jgi:hypothetical protein
MARPTLEGKLSQVEAMAENGLLDSTAEINDVIRGPSYCAGRDDERARCRSIVLKYLSKEWTGNAVLEEIGE